MMFLPRKFGTDLHNRNATWCWGNYHYDELELENKKSKHESFEEKS